MSQRGEELRDCLGGQCDGEELHGYVGGRSGCEIGGRLFGAAQVAVKEKRDCLRGRREREEVG